MSGWRTGMDRQKQKINILIRGAGFKNKGAEAMLLTTCHEIAQRLKTANFSALVSRNEIQTCKSHGICPVVTRGSNLFGKPLFLAQCLLRHPKIFSVAISSQNTAKQVLQVNNSDVILDISGYAYGDSWGIGSAQRTLTIAAYCKAKGKPYLFLPQAWGPFSDQKLAEKVTQICKNSGLVYARDKRSLSCLMGISDSSALHKEVVPDIAFKFKGEKSQVGSEALEKHGIDLKNESLIGVVPNEQIFRRVCGKGKSDQYIKTMIRMVNYCIEELGAIAVLMPHHIARPGDSKTGDLPLCALIREGVKDKKRCVSLDKDYSAATIKSIIGRLDILVASRYHSLIAALSSKIPVVAIGWSHKYPELLGLFGIEEYYVDFTELNKMPFFDILKKAWVNRNDNRQVIEKCLPSIEQKIDAMFNDVVRLMRKSL
jgi:colanic acid/amylovoran biosynthesis protein